MEKVTSRRTAISRATATTKEATNYKDRLQTEYDELVTKITALSQFIGSDTHLNLPVKEQNLMQSQRDAMRAYARILVERLK